MSNNVIPGKLVCPIDTTPISPWVVSELDVSAATVGDLKIDHDNLPVDYANIPTTQYETLLFKCSSEVHSHRFTFEVENGQPRWQDVMTGQTYPVLFRDGHYIKRLRWTTIG